MRFWAVMYQDTAVQPNLQILAILYGETAEAAQKDFFSLFDLEDEDDQGSLKEWIAIFQRPGIFYVEVPDHAITQVIKAVG